MIVTIFTFPNPSIIRYFNPILNGRFRVKIVAVYNSIVQFSGGAIVYEVISPELFTNIPGTKLHLSFSNSLNGQNKFLGSPFSFDCQLYGSITIQLRRITDNVIIALGVFLVILDVEPIQNYFLT